MSFKRLTPSDFLVSADSVTAPCWTNNVYDLTTFFTSSNQEASLQGDYVLAVYQTASTDSTAAIQFYLGFANQYGSGSTAYNSIIPGLSPSRTLYGQYKNLILEIWSFKIICVIIYVRYIFFILNKNCFLKGKKILI